MSFLGTLSFDTRLNAQAVKDAETIKKQVLHKLGSSIPLKLKVTFTSKDLRADLQNQLSKFKPKVKVDIVVDQATASQAVQQALAKAGLMNNMTAGQLRAQRAAEIQQRMQLALARAHREAATAADRHSKSILTLNSHFGNGITLGGKFSSTVASIYSVYTLKNFVQQMIEIGGEFQKQRIALESMLGSLSKADVMYKRMKELAVESPFTFMDLMSYTKQLKAFQIPYNELFDTTKRLGDISAGLGVDMNRLILAFGQVRAAAFLRGQEVRQFTEAGIPLIDALAKKFSELEKRAVSAGDVFEKISKRQVSFGMVKDVLWELTDEGGQFYNMQSKLTESLSGKLDKLKDSYQIMVAEMAQGNNAVLGGMLDTFTKLVQYGDKVIGMLATLTGIYLTYKAAVIATNAVNTVSLFISGIKQATAILNLTRAIQGLTAVTWKHVAAQRALNMVSNANWIAVGLAAITAAIGLYATFKDKTDDVTKSTRELRAEIQEEVEKMDEREAKGQELIRTMFNETKAKATQIEAYKQLQALYPEMFKNMDFEQAKRRTNIELLQMETKAAREAMKAKLDERIKDAQSRQARLKSEYEKYNISSPKDLELTKKILRQGGGEEAVEKFEKMVEQYNSVNEELDELNKIQEEVNKRADTANKNRNSKWWNTAKKLAGDLTMYAPKEDQDFEDYFEQVSKNLNNRKSLLDKMTKDAPNYDIVKNDVETLTKIYTSIGGKLNALSKFKPDSKDPELDAAKTRLQEYKVFLSEYEKYHERYSKTKSIELLEQLFPNLKGQGEGLVDNYVGMLVKLRDSLNLNTDARKNWANEVNKTIADTNLEREREIIQKNAEAMDEYTSRMEEQWKLYRSLLKKSGGNREFAQLAFNNEGAIWDDVSKEMLSKFNQRGNELGVIPIGFHWNMNEQEMKDTLVDAKGEIQTELVKLAQKIQKIIRGNYSKLLEDAAEAYNQTLTSAEKLIDLQRELNDLEKERSQYNGNDEAVIKAMDVKIEAKKREYEQAKIDAFKESSDYLNFYNAILSLTIPEAEKIGRKIKENLNEELKRGKLSARQYLTEIKRINEQLDKLRNGHSNLKSFITGGLNGLLQNMKDLGDNQWQRGINDMQQAEKDFEQAVKMYNTAQTQGNQQLMDAAESQMQASQSSMEGAKAMQKSGAAMSEGASSAMQTVAVIDMIVHGINDVVQGVKTAFDDIRETFKAAGRDTDTDSWNDWGTFLNSFSSASNSATSAWDSLKNGNIGGVISGVVGSFTGWYKGIAQGWDKKMDRQIELAGRQIKATERMRTTMERGLKRTLGSVYNYKTSQQNIEKLTEARNKTEWVDEKTYSERWRDSATGAIKGALYGLTAEIYKNNIVKLFAEGLSSKKYKTNYYNADTIAAMDKAIKSQTYYDEQYALLFKQRDELQHQLAAEQDKKDTNNEKVEDYKAQLEEIQDQIENFAEDFAKAIYDIDVKSWASELGDALFEAWQKGESGAEAFKKKASEIIAELAKNIAVVKLVETAMQPVLDVITDEMTKKSGKLDAESIEVIAEVMNLVGEKLPDSFNNLMDGLNEGMMRAGLTDMKELDNDGSSSMSSSIKSITEETADLLASYINAIRADVSVIRATQAVFLPTLSTDIHTTSVLAQTQVTLQQQIAANTLRNAEAADKIYEIMHKIDTGVTKVRIA